MAGRPTIKRASIPELKMLDLSIGRILDARLIIAYTMKNCGCTSKEIAEVFEITRQAADALVKQAEERL